MKEVKEFEDYDNVAIDKKSFDTSCPCFRWRRHWMMGACAKGVHDNNGKTFGIAPEWIGNFEPLCEECSDFIYVDSMDERKNKFLENSDVFIISPGGIGTLDEFFEINTLKKLKQHDNEIIIFNINHFFDKMIEMIDENIVLK